MCDSTSPLAFMYKIWTLFQLFLWDVRGSILTTFGGAGMQKEFGPTSLVHWGTLPKRWGSLAVSETVFGGICPKILKGCGPWFPKIYTECHAVCAFYKGNHQKGWQMSSMGLALLKKELLFPSTEVPHPCSLTCGDWVQMCSSSTAQIPIWEATRG